MTLATLLLAAALAGSPTVTYVDANLVRDLTGEISPTLTPTPRNLVRDLTDVDANPAKPGASPQRDHRAVITSTVGCTRDAAA